MFSNFSLLFCCELVIFAFPYNLTFNLFAMAATSVITAKGRRIYIATDSHSLYDSLNFVENYTTGKRQVNLSDVLRRNAVVFFYRSEEEIEKEVEGYVDYCIDEDLSYTRDEIETRRMRLHDSNDSFFAFLDVDKNENIKKGRNSKKNRANRKQKFRELFGQHIDFCAVNISKHNEAVQSFLKELNGDFEICSFTNDNDEYEMPSLRVTDKILCPQGPSLLFSDGKSKIQVVKYLELTQEAVLAFFWPPNTLLDGVHTSPKHTVNTDLLKRLLQHDKGLVLLHYNWKDNSSLPAIKKIRKVMATLPEEAPVQLKAYVVNTGNLLLDPEEKKRSELKKAEEWTLGSKNKPFFLSEGTTYLVYFFMDHCKYCKELDPKWEQLKARLADWYVTPVKVDLPRFSEWIRTQPDPKYKTVIKPIRYTPTIRFYHNGELVNQFSLAESFRTVAELTSFVTECFQDLKLSPTSAPYLELFRPSDATGICVNGVQYPSEYQGQLTFNMNELSQEDTRLLLLEHFQLQKNSAAAEHTTAEVPEIECTAVANLDSDMEGCTSNNKKHIASAVDLAENTGTPTKGYSEEKQPDTTISSTNDVVEEDSWEEINPKAFKQAFTTSDLALLHKVLNPQQISKLRQGQSFELSSTAKNILCLHNVITQNQQKKKPIIMLELLDLFDEEDLQLAKGCYMRLKEPDAPHTVLLQWLVAYLSCNTGTGRCLSHGSLFAKHEQVINRLIIATLPRFDNVDKEPDGARALLQLFLIVPDAVQTTCVQKLICQSIHWTFVYPTGWYRSSPLRELGLKCLRVYLHRLKPKKHYALVVSSLHKLWTMKMNNTLDGDNDDNTNTTLTTPQHIAKWSRKEVQLLFDCFNIIVGHELATDQEKHDLMCLAYREFFAYPSLMGQMLCNMMPDSRAVREHFAGILLKFSTSMHFYSDDEMLTAFRLWKLLWSPTCKKYLESTDFEKLVAQLLHSSNTNPKVLSAALELHTLLLSP